MKGRRLLITGVNGLIGSILQKEWAALHTVFGLDRKGPFSGRVCYADISDASQLADLFRQCSPIDAVIHLAADSHVDADWEQCLNINMIGTRNVYEAVRQVSVKRVVFASTNHVMGAYEHSPDDVSKGCQTPVLPVLSPIRPDSDYGVSKAFGEVLARYYCDRFGIASICLRIGSVLRDDDPTRDPRHMKTWLSHRDLVHLFAQSLIADIGFGIYFGVSNNRDRFWSLEEAAAEIGYFPVDDAASYRA
jgi:NAD+ dependent glucose-6-phosphate dehydrogenase